MEKPAINSRELSVFFCQKGVFLVSISRKKGVFGQKVIVI